MTSARKLVTNRQNSLRSTGPNTAVGRARAAGNARRHGLRVPVLSDPLLSAEVEATAREIAGDASQELIELARRIAEAEVDVMRVRRVRNDLLRRVLSNLGNRIPVAGSQAESLEPILRIEPESQSELAPKLLPIADGPEIMHNLLEFGREFTLIDNYERRALSRRKFAIRAFDEARAANRSNAATP
jgi:hypothetical protein